MFLTHNKQYYKKLIKTSYYTQQDTMKFTATTCNKQNRYKLQKHWAFIHSLIKIPVSAINTVLIKEKQNKNKRTNKNQNNNNKKLNQNTPMN